MICLWKIYLESSYVYDGIRLNLIGFTLIRADNPHNCKKGGVNIYLAVCPVRPPNLNEYPPVPIT